MVENLVSIILPTYNRAYCLPQTIDSVLSQTYQDYEIIIVDDGSTDDTYELIKSYTCEKRLKYIKQANGGVSAARNTAIRYAQGEFLAFCDSDDIWHKSKLELQITCLKAFPEAGLIWTDLTSVDSSGTVLNQRYTRVAYNTWSLFSMEELFHTKRKLSEFDVILPDDENKNYVYVGDIFSPMVTGNIINMPTVMMRSILIEKVGYFDESMVAGEDYDFNLRVCQTSHAAFIDNACLNYRVGASDQLSRPELYAEQARNCLRTILPILSQDKVKLKLSNSEFSKILGRKYKWLGNVEFDLHNWSEARSALFKSLIYGEYQLRSFIIIVVSFLPGGLINYLRASYQKMNNKRHI